MRLGINKTFHHENPREWAEKMHRLDCRSVIFPVDSSSGRELIEEYMEAAKSYDLQFAEVGIWKNQLSPDRQEQKRVIDFSIEQLKLADYVGAQCCVNVAGAIGPLWDGPYKENFSKDTWNQMIAVIQEIIDRACPQKTFFTIEPLPWMYPTGPDEYLQMMRDVNRKQFAVHMDLVNMINCPKRYFFNEEFTDQCFEKLGPYIKSCHLKDVLLDDKFTFRLYEKPCGEGGLNLNHYLEKIGQLSLDMPVLIEHLHTEEEFTDSLQYVQKHFSQFF